MLKLTYFSSTTFVFQVGPIIRVRGVANNFVCEKFYKLNKTYEKKRFGPILDDNQRVHEYSNERGGRHYNESELSRYSIERQLWWFNYQYGPRCTENFQFVFDWYHIAHASQQHWVSKCGYLKAKCNISNNLQSSSRCSESYIQVNGGERICGNRKTQLIYSKCGTSFKLNYFVGTKAYKGFKFFYECE